MYELLCASTEPKPMCMRANSVCNRNNGIRDMNTVLIDLQSIWKYKTNSVNKEMALHCIQCFLSAHCNASKIFSPNYQRNHNV